VESETQTDEINRSRRGATDAMSTYDLHMRAQRLLRSSNMHDNAQASALYDEVLAREPENVAYLAGACGALHHRIAMGWQALAPGDAQRCHDYALRGLHFASRDADAMALFGIAIMMTGDPDLGHATMQRAAEINPNSVHAVQIAGQGNMHWGNLDRAEQQLRHAYRLNPRDHNQRFVLGSLARIRLSRGDVEGAARIARQAFAVNQHYNPIQWTLIASAAHLGRAEQAERYLRRFADNNPGVTLSSIARARPSVGSRNASLLEGLEAAGMR
jgi:tetratricopeptide (TPR) repeat protein